MTSIAEDAWLGCLLGTAIGDALGLPREGLSRRRAAKMFGAAELRHRLVLGRGMLSDDGEHACMTVQALIAARGDPDRFSRSLGWRLRGWLAGVPAGVGLATLRAILKLWLGYSPAYSGVRSAGNGPGMRAAPVGLYCAAASVDLASWVRAATCLTHTDPRAIEGALAIAWAAGYGATHGPVAGGDKSSYDSAALWGSLLPLLKGPELHSHLNAAAQALADGRSAVEYADSLGLSRGVTGYINHTVPLALYCWLRHWGDFRAAVTAAVQLGGDSDTVGAIVGGLCGATLGVSAIPADWVDGLWDWPRSTVWIRRLAQQAQKAAAGDGTARPVGLFWPGLPLRNLFFLAIVLLHGFRRLLPPY